MIVTVNGTITIEPGKADDINVYSLGKAEKVIIDILDDGNECMSIKLDRVAAWKLSKAIHEITKGN